MSELWGQGHSPCTPLRPPTLSPTTTGSEQQARTHTQGLADGCGPHCLRGPDHHCTLPATPQGVLPSPHLPLTPGQASSELSFIQPSSKVTLLGTRAEGTTQHHCLEVAGI